MPIRQKLFLLLFLLFSIPNLSLAQNVRYDTLFVKKGNTVIMKDTTFTLLRDSMFIVPDTVQILTGKTGKSFYEKLKISASKNKLTKELYNLAFSAPAQVDTAKTVKAETPYLPYDGKVIRNINIKSLDIFGPTINDTTRQAATWIGKTANKLHHNTRQWVIKQSLLFKNGDKVNPYLLAENATVLRRLPYLEDATIIIQQVSKDSVDIQVVTKDIFPLDVTPDITSLTEVTLKGRSVNVLGLGIGTSHAISVDAEREKGRQFRYDLGKININNIGGTFINSEMSYQHKSDSLVKSISISRSIIPLKFDYFGGTKYYTGQWYYPLIDNDSVLKTQTVTFNEFDLYMGRSFVNRKYKVDARRSPVIKTLAGRYQYVEFKNRPFVSADSNFRLQTARNLFASFCISKQDYFNTSFFYEFGRTEDIPIGYQVIWLGGYQFGEFFERTYLGTTAKAAGLFPKMGYLYGEINLGGFVHNNRFEQGVFSVKSIYATNSIRMNRSRLRFYVKSTFTYGINPLPSDTLYIEEIHGFPDDFTDLLPGNQRFTISPEINVFTPWYLYGFRFSIFGYSDLAWIGFEGKSIFRNPLRMHIGSGLRVKNENLIFDTFELSLSYVVNAPPGENPFAIMLGTVQSLRFPQFMPSKPQKIRFK